jgi:NADH:ubiquinone oxidoreductase subunit D
MAYRMRIRTPDFVNLQVLPYMADSVALIGTIDIVLGSVDR